MANSTSILFILPGLGFGGAEVLTMQIIDFLVRTRGYNLSLIVIGSNLDLLSQVNPSCKVICLHLSGRINPFLFITSLTQALKIFKEANVVVPTLYISQFFAVLLTVVTFSTRPTLACVHNCSFALREIGISSYLSLCSFFLLRFHPKAAYIFCSHSSFSTHRRFVTGKQSFVITNGFTKPDDDPNLISSYLPHCLMRGRITTSATRILFIARYHPHKDYPTFLLTLLTLVKTRSDFSVTVIGATYEHLSICIANLKISQILKQELIQLVNKHISIYSPHPNVSYFYETHDILLLTSLSEAFPNVVVEAQVFGLYVVSTDVGDIPHMVYDPSLLAPRGSHTLLSNRIISAIILHQSKSHCKIKQKIICFAQNNFSALRMLNLYLKLICDWADS